jgi:hypothetical protein
MQEDRSEKAKAINLANLTRLLSPYNLTFTDIISDDGGQAVLYKATFNGRTCAVKIPRLKDGTATRE